MYQKIFVISSKVLQHLKTNVFITLFQLDVPQDTKFSCVCFQNLPAYKPLTSSELTETIESHETAHLRNGGLRSSPTPNVRYRSLSDPYGDNSPSHQQQWEHMWNHRETKYWVQSADVALV